MKELQRLLRMTEQFIQDVEGGTNCPPKQAFWRFAWEVPLLLQKILMVLVAQTAAPEAGTASEIPLNHTSCERSVRAKYLRV